MSVNPDIIFNNLPHAYSDTCLEPVLIRKFLISYVGKYFI